MKVRRKSYIAAIAMLGLSLPIWARTESAPLHVDQTVTIGNQQLGPGDYNLKANDGDSQIRVVRNDDGKTIATVRCQWIDLSRKASQTEVELKQNQIVQIDFGGKAKAVEIR
jgi:hypothetical protein